MKKRKFSEFKSEITNYFENVLDWILSNPKLVAALSLLLFCMYQLLHSRVERLQSLWIVLCLYWTALALIFAFRIL